MLKKIVVVTLMFILMICINCNKVKAESIMDKIFGDGENFVSLGNPDSSDWSNEQVKNTSDTIYNILFGIAMVLAIIVGMILGIKFITSSVEGKAEIKQSLTSYIVAVVIMFGAFTIWKLTIELLN